MTNRSKRNSTPRLTGYARSIRTNCAHATHSICSTNYMSWRRTLRMRRVKADLSTGWPGARRMVRTRVIVTGLSALFLLAGRPHRAQAEAPPLAPLTFAIASNVLDKPAGETALQHLLNAIGQERNTSFIVYDGDPKAKRNRAGIRFTTHASKSSIAPAN